MKPSKLIRAIMASMIVLGLITSGIYYSNIINKNKTLYITNDNEYKSEVISFSLDDSEETTEEKVEEVVVPERNEVYEGMTMEELADKLNRSLSSDLTGMGSSFAKYSIELGVDPYLAVAITLQETGCAWNCSSLMKQCNNVGGQKGEGCGEYKAYDTLDEGIYGFILNIKNNYVDFGMHTAEEMNPKYAEDPTWSSKVNNYIEKIRNN